MQTSNEEPKVEPDRRAIAVSNELSLEWRISWRRSIDQVKANIGNDTYMEMIVAALEKHPLRLRRVLRMRRQSDTVGRHNEECLLGF